MSPRETAESAAWQLGMLRKMGVLGPPGPLAPTPEDLADLVAWVTAALPVVEAVRELQEAKANRQKVLGSSRAVSTLADRVYHNALHGVETVACPVSK